MGKIKNFFIRTGIVLTGLVVLFLVCHTALNIYANRKIKAEINKIKEKGEPLSLQDLIQEPIPEEENAVTIYNKVFSLLNSHWKELDKAYSVKSYADISQWSDEEKKDIPIILEKYNEIFNLLHEASLRNKCNFNLDYTKGAELPLPHLVTLRSCARFLLIRATLDMEKGDTDNAIERIIDGFAVARASRNDNTLISDLVRIACDAILLDGIENLFKNKEISYNNCQSLYKVLKEERQARLISFVGERCFGKDAFEGILSGRIRAEETICEVIGTFKGEIITLFMRTYLYRPFFKLDYAWYLKIMDRYIELAKRPYWEDIDAFSEKDVSDTKKKSQGIAWALTVGFDPEVEAMAVKGIPKICFLTRMLAPSLLQALEKETKNDALLGSAELAMALRMYKIKHEGYPLSLNELIPEIIEELPKDPFTGKDFIYKRKGEGFIVYSLGDNCKDDGGNWGKPSRWSGDFDIVFEMVR